MPKQCTLYTTAALALLTLGGFSTVIAGCSPAPSPPPEAPAAPEAQEAPAAPEAPIPPEAAAPTASAEGQETPAAPALPEVTAVNTAQLGGLLDKTLGKVTVLNIWATWCGPCIHEMPELVRFYNQTDRDSLAFVSLSVDNVDAISGEIPNFQRTHKVPFPILVLNERNDEGMFKALRGLFRGGIPATFIYDKSGKLVKMIEGAVTQAELNKVVQPLLDAPAQPVI